MGLITNSLLVGTLIYAANRRAMRKSAKFAPYTRRRVSNILSEQMQNREMFDDRSYYIWPPLPENPEGTKDE